MANDVKLRIGADTSDLEKAFGSLIKKIQNDADKLKLSPAATAARSSGGSAAGTIRDAERGLAKEKAALDSYNRSLEMRKKTLDDILKLEAKGIDQTKQKQVAEERLSHARQVAAVQQQTYDRTQQTVRKNMGLPGTAPPSPGPNMFSSPDILKGVLGAAGIGISAKFVIDTIKKDYDYQVTREANLKIDEGSTSQNSVGYLNQSILSGDVAHQSRMQNQMAEANKTATQSFETLGNKYYKFLALTDFAFDKEGKRMETYNSARANTIAKDTLALAQAGLERDNSGQLGESFFGQTFNRNLNAERAQGLGTDQFKKFQIGVNNKGFLTDQSTTLLNQVQAAGGAASGAQGANIATTGLEMQRAFNLTNSGNILGKLTGVYGNSASGVGKMDDAARRILEEAITKGFDKSENTEILRKFTETSAGSVYQAEAKTGLDVERITSDFSRLLSDNPTMKQFEAAKTAFDQYQSLTSATSGRGGTLGFASSIREKNLSKLSAMQIGNLMNIPENMLTSTNSDVVSAAAQQGVSPEDMVTSLLNAKKTQALGTVGLSEKQLNPLKKYLGGRDVLSLLNNGGEELKKIKKTNPEVFGAFQELQQRSGLIGPYTNDETRKEQMEILYNGPAKYGKGTSNTSEVKARLATGTGGKREEEYIASQAAQEKQLVLNLKGMEDQLYPTTKGIADLTQKIMQLGVAAHLLNTGELGAALNKNAVTGAVETKGSLGRTPQSGSKPRSGAGGDW